MNIVVYFSGGVDSTGALLWAVRVFGQEKVHALHAVLDTELPGIYDHVIKIVEYLEVDYVEIKSLKSLEKEFKIRELPFFANPWCKKEFVHKPLNKFVRANYDPTETLLVFGGNRKEKVDKLLNSDGTFRKAKRTFYKRFSELKKYPTIQPFFDWPKQYVIDFIKQEKVPIWEGYEKGFKRTACWICPFQSQKQLHALIRNEPQLFKKLRKFEKLKGRGIGCKGQSIIDFALRNL